MSDSSGGSVEGLGARRLGGGDNGNGARGDGASGMLAEDELGERMVFGIGNEVGRREESDAGNPPLADRI